MLLVFNINLPHILLKRIMEVIKTTKSNLVYSTLLTKVFVKERINVGLENEQIELRYMYDIYYKSNLDILLMVLNGCNWKFKFPEEYKSALFYEIYNS